MLQSANCSYLDLMSELVGGTLLSGPQCWQRCLSIDTPEHDSSTEIPKDDMHHG